ncbi:hypothetical protein CYLTODRAFT_395467 [Cylindrobasidium torrendii FP15055 ss-10]|uniref:F-box domain-containing protein n=1 Tax=Cylindrobasidium torrendii FP15055 ss-10 TaxID=1314674 RepID=A0A0D7BCU9_9AGAR|nr:hypothetical protein CYLTODRAFT_395467 [Cylindrobasidium torrendii FP15055 ss-10]
MPSLSLTLLPPEVLTETLLYLDVRSLTRCSAVCRTLDRIIRGSVAINYLIELGFEDMDDPCIAPGTTSDRLRRLRARGRAWAQLDWGPISRIPSPGECSAYEVIDGQFVKMVWGKEITVLNLPSVGTKASLEHKDDVDGMIKDFALDPSQDLIVYLEDDASPPSFAQPRKLTMHIRTLSTNQPHPKAKRPILPITIDPDDTWANMLGLVTIQLMEDTLVLFVRNPFTSSRLVVWNWKDGEELADFDAHEENNAIHFGFIDSRTFLLSCSTQPGGCISIMRLEEGKSEPRWIASLLMPETKPGVRVDACITHCSAVPRHPSRPTPAPNKRIHTFTLTYTRENDTDENHASHCLFVPNDFFLKVVAESRRGYEPRIIPWHEWGTANSRFVKMAGTYHWMRYVSGQKVVCPAPPDGDVVRIYDFNIHPTRLLPESDVLHAELGCGRVRRGKLFKRDVWTALPYYELTRKVEHEYSGYMIDEQRIIGLQTSEGPDGLELEYIDVYPIKN